MRCTVGVHKAVHAEVAVVRIFAKVTAVAENIAVVRRRAAVNGVVAPFPNKAAHKAVILHDQLLVLFRISGAVTHRVDVLAKLGVQNPVNIMGEASAFQHVYVWSDVWQHAGWDSIIYIAALAAVDPSLYEAATVDGASKIQRLWHIDVPFLIPTAVILLIMRAGNVMNLGFEKVYLMQNPLNTSISEVISTYVYKIGMISNQYSLSAAVNLFNTVINFVLLLLVNGFSKKLGDTSLW